MDPENEGIEVLFAEHVVEPPEIQDPGHLLRDRQGRKLLLSHSITHTKRANEQLEHKARFFEIQILHLDEAMSLREQLDRVDQRIRIIEREIRQATTRLANTSRRAPEYHRILALIRLLRDQAREKMVESAALDDKKKLAWRKMQEAGLKVSAARNAVLMHQNRSKRYLELLEHHRRGTWWGKMKCRLVGFTE